MAFYMATLFTPWRGVFVSDQRLVIRNLIDSAFVGGKLVDKLRHRFDSSQSEKSTEILWNNSHAQSPFGSWLLDQK